MRYRLVLILFFLSSRLLGQEIKKQYFLRGVDDSLRYSITLEEDLINEAAIFTVQKGTVKIFGVQEVQTEIVHADTFLEIQFRVRGGAGVKVRRKVLLCVSQGKVHKTLDILSEITSRLNTVYDKVADSLKLFDEKEDYHVTTSIKQTEDRHYKAILLESTKVESKYNPNQNVSFEKPYELDFDPVECLFYNSMKQLNKRYKIYSSRESKTVERFIRTEVPCIQLYEKLYLFIDNEWCLDNGHDSLSCL